MKRHILFLTLMVIALACQRTSTPVGDTSRNALDWEGTYRGLLPCADCRGILVAIQLNADQSFTMSLSYLGKSEPGQTKEGTFTWNEAGNEITLKGINNTTPVVYKVGENRLIPLNTSATGPLTRNTNDITNRYWRLVRVNDREVSVGDNRSKEAHLILLSDSTAMGNASCNGFHGTYKLTGSDGISFSPLAATKMACMENMDIENQYLQAMMEVTRYQVSGDTLLLLKDQDVKLLTFRVR